LITGITGFVGPHLAQHISETAPEAEVSGLVWEADNSEAPSFVKKVEGDLTDLGSLRTAFELVQPEIIFHLAAASSVASSWENPGHFLEVNAVGTVNLLEIVREAQQDVRVVVSSSGEIYGAVPVGQQPITEEEHLAPLSPYAASKAAQDLLAAQYFHGFGIPTVRLRLFHHTGPRRPPQFVASSFAHQIARIEMGLDPPRLAVGNLEAQHLLEPSHHYSSRARHPSRRLRGRGRSRRGPGSLARRRHPLPGRRLHQVQQRYRVATGDPTRADAWRSPELVARERLNVPTFERFRTDDVEVESRGAPWQSAT
jgi:GDP-D-mannose dehydratase